MKLAALTAALALLAAACGDDAQAAPAAAAGAPQGVPVSVARAVRRDVPVRLRAVGTVESPAAVVLTPRIDGQVAELAVREGADVEAGELLLVIDRAPFEAAVHSAEAALARDAAMADDAARSLASWNSLTDKRAMSQRSLEQAEAAAAAAAATVRADEAALEFARLTLSWCEVRAPFAGRIGRVLVRPGSGVERQSTELLSLRQIAPIRVSFALPEARLAQVRAHGVQGAEVEVVVSGGGTARGTLGFVDNAVDPATGTILLLADVANEDRALWPGQLVDVALIVAVERDAVLVPGNAVQPGQDGDFVFVVGADAAVELRRIRVARVDGDEAVIAEGLTGDETVVTDGQIRLVPGARVAPKSP